MANTKVHVWHSPRGEIIAVGHPVANSDSKLRVIPTSGENQAVIETEIDGKLVKNLHQTHIVDVDKKVLMEHPHKKHKQIGRNPGNNKEWLWDGTAWEIGKGDLDGWVIRQPLVMESEFGGLYGTEDDFQRLLVAKADHRLLVYDAKTEAQANEIIDSCKKGIAAFAKTERGDRYLFACWLEERQKLADPFIFRLHIA